MIHLYYTAAMSMDERARFRFLLSLRSEAVMGLRSTRSYPQSGSDGSSQSDEDKIQDAVDAADAADASMMQPLVAVAPLHVARTHAVVSPPVKVSPVKVSPVEYQQEIGLLATVTKPIDLPVLSTKQKSIALAEMNAKEVSICTKCRLNTTRTQTVFGEGDVDATIFFIGEGPGENEDETGRPFVGRAGQLLDKMIAAMGISRQQVFIANIVKCRPPGNRVPAPDEVATCTPYLVRQLEIVRPKVIVTLGLPAVKYMLEDPKLTMGRMRGQWRSWRGIKLMPTYHPSYVLRAYTEANRQAVWSDLQLVMQEVGLPAKRAAPK